MLYTIVGLKSKLLGTCSNLEEPLKETFIKEKAIQKYECHRHYLEDDNKCDPRSFKRL